MITEAEFRHLHSFLLDVLKPHLSFPPPVPEEVQKVVEQEAPSADSAAAGPILQGWLELLDGNIGIHRLRLYGHEKGIAEPVCRALLCFWIGKSIHSEADRDKVDWVAVHLFRTRERETGQPTGWVKTELQSLLEGMEFPRVAREAQVLLDEFPPLLDDVRFSSSFSQLVSSGIIERGRELKKQLGDAFFHPVVLSAIVNYDLILEKKFNELLEKEQVRKQELGAERRSANTPTNLRQLLQGEYRENVATGQYALVTGASTPETASAAAEEELALAPVEEFLEKQSRRLGIDAESEELKVRARVRDLATNLQTNPAIRSVRICGNVIPLEAWEVQALRNLITHRADDLKGAFARGISRAVALLVRIQEEQYAYETKRKTGDPAQKHFDSLFHLIFEGRSHQGSLLRLSLLHRRHGFPELAQQLQSTTDKLHTSLSRVEQWF